MKTRPTLPESLQGLVLSYVEVEDQENPQDSLKQDLEKSFEKGVEVGLIAGHLSAFGPLFVSARFLDEGSKIQNPFIKVPAVLATLGVGIGASIFCGVASPVVGIAIGVTKGLVDFSIFSGKKAVKTIKNAIIKDPAKIAEEQAAKKAVEDISYFVDPKNLLNKINSKSLNLK